MNVSPRSGLQVPVIAAGHPIHRYMVRCSWWLLPSPPGEDPGQALRRYGSRISDMSIRIMTVEMNDTTTGA